MSKTTTYLLLGGAALVGLYLLTSTSSPLKLGASGSSGTMSGWLNGIASIEKATGGLYTSIFGGSSDGYTPDVTRGDDTSVV